ncbi:MAG: hypothetical protein P4L50_17835 [Anaerolineaceae bacterium]|nr:hypothetical protein [Anaerolineaceae bacterium]
MAIMRQHIQDASGRPAKELIKTVRKGLKELEAGVLREIDRFQDSCVQTKELREMRKLDSEGRYAELYVYAKSLHMREKNKAAMGELNKRLRETIDKASYELMKVLNKTAAAKQYKPIFSTYKKNEVFVLKHTSCKDQENVLSALHSAGMSKLIKAVYIDSLEVIGDRVASGLASHLKTHPISALYLVGGWISDAGAEELALAVSQSSLISTLCISGGNISDSGAKAVAEAARGCRSLTVFYLNGGDISDSGAKAVAEVVKRCPLSVFYIGGYEISDSGAEAVAETMKDCPLSTFCIYCSEMSDAGAISVAKTMKDCPLSAFYLSCNKISDSGATAVAEILSSGGCANTLSAFCLDTDGISDSGAKKVADAIRNCTRLSSFYLYGKPLSGDTVANILEGMIISTIRTVNLYIGEVSKPQMDSCLDRLQQSGAARQLKLRFQCDTDAVATESMCDKYAAEWDGKLSEFRVVRSIDGLFKKELILGTPM